MPVLCVNYQWYICLNYDFDLQRTKVQFMVIDINPHQCVTRVFELKANKLAKPLFIEQHKYCVYMAS